MIDDSMLITQRYFKDNRGGGEGVAVLRSIDVRESMWYMYLEDHTQNNAYS